MSGRGPKPAWAEYLFAHTRRVQRGWRVLRRSDGCLLCECLDERTARSVARSISDGGGATAVEVVHA